MRTASERSGPHGPTPSACVMNVEPRHPLPPKRLASAGDAPPPGATRARIGRRMSRAIRDTVAVVVDRVELLLQLVAGPPDENFDLRRDLREILGRGRRRRVPIGAARHSPRVGA